MRKWIVHVLIMSVLISVAMFAMAVAYLIVHAESCPPSAYPEPHPPTEHIEMPEWMNEPEPEPEPIRERVTSIFAEPATAETIDLDGEELRLIGTWHITEYCPCRICNGGYTGTASGNPLTVGRTVASNSLPLGTEVYIEGYGWRVVEDRGGGGSQWIDVLVADHEDAQSVEGNSYRKVWVRA